MNFLSHLHLSGESTGIIIGNYIADSVKGNSFTIYPAEVQKGIILHRKIDWYTDNHPLVEQSKHRLREKYKKYAGVIVDIYYDHYLAANWQLYHNTQLDEFVQNIYAIVQEHQHLLPEKSALFTHYMLQHNILKAYASFDGIEKVLNGMARRTPFNSNMEYAINDLKEHYPLFENEFKQFFPELQLYVNAQLTELP